MHKLSFPMSVLRNFIGRAEFDPLAEFNKYLKKKGSPPRGGPRSPTRRRSPPRAYRRPRSREKERYYAR